MLFLREMEEKDSGEIAKLERNIFSDAWTAAAVEETWEQPHAFVVVAEENKRILGYCIVYYVLDEAEIARIAVSKEERCKGAGSRILEETERLCREKGVKRLLLDVRTGNETAKSFYVKHGFGTDGIRRNFYDNPVEDAVLMSKILP